MGDERTINIVLDGLPGPEGGRFVKVEDDDGNDLKAGKWRKRPDGQWALRIFCRQGVAEQASRRYVEDVPEPADHVELDDYKVALDTAVRHGARLVEDVATERDQCRAALRILRDKKWPTQGFVLAVLKDCGIDPETL